MAILVLVRHAQTIWNAEERWQGQTDIPLSPDGEVEVAHLARRLARERFERVIASDLTRARDTALGVVRASEHARLDVEVEPALREMHLGAWCGLPHAEVAARFPDEVAALARGDDRRIGGDGETVVELARRVCGAIDRIARECGANDRVLVVTHGGVIRSILLETLQLSGRTRPLIGAGNTAITIVTSDGSQRRVVSYNDRTHLMGFGHEAPHAGEETIGEGARTRVVAMLGLADDAPLDEAPAGTTSRVIAGKRQLVAYAVPPRAPSTR